MSTLTDRHCEERSDEAIQKHGAFWIASPPARNDDLLRRVTRQITLPRRDCPELA
jgi:hypothetical protein